MIDLIIRPYQSSDFAACLAVFTSNVPLYFAPEEYADFCQHLECVNHADKPYLVLTHKDSIIACGGLVIETTKRQTGLSWGMVDRNFHGRGLGTSLTEARLALARVTPNIDEVVLETSQHTRRFYEGFGFTAVKVIPNGFADGLDRWEMKLRLYK